MSRHTGAQVGALGAVLCLLLSGGAQAQDAGKGKMIYTGRCAFCHGATGKGDGPAGAALKPPDTNFARADFWKNTKPEAIKEAIEHGKPSTAMVAFQASLTAQQIADVIAYLKTFQPQ